MSRADAAQFCVDNGGELAIIRSVAEQAHERRDPSKMHQGGIPGQGIPTDFTPGY